MLAAIATLPARYTVLSLERVDWLTQLYGYSLKHVHGRYRLRSCDLVCVEISSNEIADAVKFVMLLQFSLLRL